MDHPLARRLTDYRADPVFSAQLGLGANRWDHYPQVVEDLKEEAKKLGIWNMFLPKGHYKESPGFTNLEYGLIAEQLGKSKVASEACNCAAPDTGNMEVLAKYGNDAQKKQWLKPLMDGEIRSAFLMTEPEVASSDATNIQMSMRKEGNEWVLNGQVGLNFLHVVVMLKPLRNGGPVDQVIQDVRFILSWPRAIQGIRMFISNNQ